MALDPGSRSTRLPKHERAILKALRISAVLSTYHEDLTAEMLGSAWEELASHGVDTQAACVVRAPGAFEIPLLARALARRKDIDAVLCFGLVLKGETTHDHWVSSAAIHGLMQVGLETDKPILLGILTCNTLEQARARALPASRGGKLDKGREVARAAVSALLSLEAARRKHKKSKSKA
jgi:6,7-dimethyl-8-ribityllumazine synthase